MVKSGTLDKSEDLLVQPGGYQMRHAIKHSFEEKGYNIKVGKLIKKAEGSSMEIETIEFKARYVVSVSEKDPSFSPILCFMNGFYWWNFYVSIRDQKTEREILSWTARGCSGTMMGKLDRYLEELERKD
jgi:hypothetical protein